MSGLFSLHSFNFPFTSTHYEKALIMFFTVLLQQLDVINENWGNVAQHVLDCNYTLSSAEKLETFRRIKEFYFGDEDISFAKVKELIKVRKHIQTCIRRNFFGVRINGLIHHTHGAN